MANHKSAIKKVRQDITRRERNRWHRARLRTKLKNFRKAIEAGDTETAENMLISTLSLIDRSVKHGVLHENAGRRHKSRIEKALQRAKAAA